VNSRPLHIALLITIIAVVTTGCAVGSGPKQVSDVRTCLEKALPDGTIDATSVSEQDDAVEDAVFATSGLAAAGDDAAAGNEEFVMAIAATVRSQETVEEFTKDSKRFTETLAQGGDEKLDVTSGSDGRYVWVVAGAPDADGYEAALECVTP
jgi:hypothetical protein